MRRSALAMLLSVLLVGSALAQKPVDPPVVFTPALGIAPGGTVADALREPLPDSYTVQAVPPATTPHTIRNCADYLALSTDKELFTGSALDDRTLLAVGARCVALDWIRNAPPLAAPGKPTAAHGSGTRTWRTLRVAELPPALALIISDDDQAAAQKATKAGKSILAMEPDLKLSDRTATMLRLTCPDWTELLTLYARGDFLGTGDEQWIVRGIAGANGGTYVATHLFLLRPGRTGWVVARTYPQD